MPARCINSYCLTVSAKFICLFFLYNVNRFIITNGLRLQGRKSNFVEVELFDKHQSDICTGPFANESYKIINRDLIHRNNQVELVKFVIFSAYWLQTNGPTISRDYSLQSGGNFSPKKHFPVMFWKLGFVTSIHRPILRGFLAKNQCPLPVTFYKFLNRPQVKKPKYTNQRFNFIWAEYHLCRLC